MLIIRLLQKTITFASIIITVLAVSLYAETSTVDSQKTIKAGTIGIAYDEGLSVKYFVADKFCPYLSVFYSVDGEGSASPVLAYDGLQHFSIKIGATYTLKTWEKLMLETFAEVVEQYNEEGYPAPGADNMFHSYSVSNTLVRVGICPELYLNQHFSISYKMGLEFGNYGTAYKKDYLKFGIYGPGQKTSVFNNAFSELAHIGLNVYF
jgi:hypothetical protein